MRISHELPLSLLNKSYEWNDYDYCLPHLLDKYPKYLEYFLQAKQDGRFIIMDNGLFEGINHTIEDLASKINLIQPNIFIVPDAWNDSTTTIKNAVYWKDYVVSKYHLPKETELMVVIQGTTLNNMEYVMKHCEIIGYTYFAFNHSSITYQGLFDHPNKLVNQMLGRIQVISHFQKQGLLDDKYIHLLGCSLPQEFSFYRGIDIASIDTSNPIICGALKIPYNFGGLLMKPDVKIDDIIEEDLKSNRIIESNVKLFKYITQL